MKRLAALFLALALAVPALAQTPVGGGSVVSTGSVTPRTLPDRFADTLNVLDYGCVGNANATTGGLGTDNATCLAAVRSKLVAMRDAGQRPPKVVFPKTASQSGIFETTVWPDFTAFPHLWLAGQAGTVLRYVGATSTYGFDFNGPNFNAPPNAVGMHISDLVFQCNGNVTSCVRFKNIWHGVIDRVQSYNGDPSSGAMFVFEAGTLLSVYDLKASRNLDDTWAGGQNAYYGILTVGVLAATNFYNPIVELAAGPGIRMQTGAVLNSFTGGTSEGNGGAGVVIDSGVTRAWFTNFDLEGNGSFDYDISGDEINVTGGNAGTQVPTDKGIMFRSTAERNVFAGGRNYTVNSEVGAVGNIIADSFVASPSSGTDNGGVIYNNVIYGSTGDIIKNPPVAAGLLVLADDTIGRIDTKLGPAAFGGGTVFFRGDVVTGLYGSFSFLGVTGAATSLDENARSTGITIDYATASVAPTDPTVYVDGRWTLVACRDGSLYVVNRVGGTRNVWWSLFPLSD